MAQLDRVVIHIGSDKAGSTALQRALAANLDWYSAHAIHVVRTEMTRSGHYALFRALDDEATLARLADEFTQLPPSCRTLIFSWEGVHNFNEAHRLLLGEVLHRLLPNAPVMFVYYVRNQVDLVQSGVLQRVKKGVLPPSIVGELNRPLFQIPQKQRQLLFDDNRLFHQRLMAWQASFPSASFKVRLYARDRLVNGDIVDDFNELIGVASDSDLERTDLNPNVSLTADAAVVLAHELDQGVTADQVKGTIDALLRYSTVGGSTSFLHEDSRQVIAQYYARDNARLVEAYPRCTGVEQVRSAARPVITPEEIATCAKFLHEQRCPYEI